MRAKRYIFISLSAAVLSVLFLISGCLLTVGAPLARKVEPGKWTLEASAGSTQPSGTETVPGIHAYLYAGRALGKHFEIGLLPYYYKVNTSGILKSIEAGVIAVPLKWDPFNYDFPFHLTVYAAPSLFMGDINGFILYEGIGLSYDLPIPLELYASYSIPYYAFPFFTGNIGFRYKLNPNLALGANFMVAMPLTYGVNITLSTILGK